MVKSDYIEKAENETKKSETEKREMVLESKYDDENLYTQFQDIIEKSKNAPTQRPNNEKIIEKEPKKNLKIQINKNKNENDNNHSPSHLVVPLPQKPPSPKGNLLKNTSQLLWGNDQSISTPSLLDLNQNSQPNNSFSSSSQNNVNNNYISPSNNSSFPSNTNSNPSFQKRQKKNYYFYFFI